MTKYKLEEFKEWLTIHPNCSKELNWTIAFQDRNFQLLLTEGHWTFLYNRLRSLYLSQWEKYMAVLEQWRKQSDSEEEETKENFVKHEERLDNYWKILHSYGERIVKLENRRPIANNNPSSFPFLTNHWKALLIMVGIAIVSYLLLK